MEKAKNVIDYYVLCNKLKTVIRTGWLDWNVKQDRLESVAEHIYGTQMLALSMASEFNYDIDIKKVLYMLAIHELEEIFIGDLTQFQISKEEKQILGHRAVEKVLASLIKKEEMISLIKEFDEEVTKEAIFAHYCDKLECDIQCKLYDEANSVNLEEENKCSAIENEMVKTLLDQGMSWSSMWILFSQNRYNYDEHFQEVSDYILTHKLTKTDN